MRFLFAETAKGVYVLMIENFEKYLDLLHERRFVQLKQALAELYEQDIAEFLGEVSDDDDVLKIFRLLPKNMCADVFSYIDSDLQEKLIQKLSDNEIHRIIEDLSDDDATDLLEEMPANVASRILANSSAETRQTINKLLQYKDDTAGSVMTTEYIDLKSGMTVDEAFASIRKRAKEIEQINTLYVTDKSRVLQGVISIRDLILADHSVEIDTLMQENIIYTETSDDQETLAHLFTKYDVLSIPVVDKEQRLVGIVTVDDIIDVISEETTEDISLMAGVTSSSDKPYLKTSAVKLWWSRIPWLLLLMVSATFTAIILNAYEASLAAVLVACVPMLMGTGGNAGGQASVTVIRGMSLKEVEVKDFFKVVWKELRVGLFCATILGIVCFGKLILIDGMLFGYDYNLLNSMVVSLSLAITVIMAKLVGAILPFVAKLIRLDPAVVASPFITTIIDVLSLLLFVAFSSAIL